MSCSLSYLLDSSSLGAKERKAHIHIGPLGQFSSQWKWSPCCPCWLPEAVHRLDYVTPLFMAHIVHIILTVLCFGLWVWVFLKKKEHRLLKGMEYSQLMSWAMLRQVISASRNQDGNKAPKQRGAEGSELQGGEDRNVCSNKQIINGFLLHIHRTSSTWTKSGKILPLWVNISHSAQSITFYVYKFCLWMREHTHTYVHVHTHVHTPTHKKLQPSWHSLLSGDTEILLLQPHLTCCSSSHVCPQSGA